MGKEDTRRPRLISKEEEAIRYALAYGRITFAEYEKRYLKLKKQGKVWRK